MGEQNEPVICLTKKEVLVLKEWFQFICLYSQAEERDKRLVEKLAKFIGDIK